MAKRIDEIKVKTMIRDILYLKTKLRKELSQINDPFELSVMELNATIAAKVKLRLEGEFDFSEIIETKI